MKWSISFVLISASFYSLFAKDTLSVRNKFLVAGANALAYKGSLQKSYARWTPGFQFGVYFQKRKLVNGMLTATFGQVIGEDRDYSKPAKFSDQIQPVSKFQTNIFSLQYELQLLLFRYKGFRLFASQGIGFLRFTPKDWEGNSLIEKDRTRAPDESYSKNSIQFPTQVGLQYWFPNKMGFGIQAGWLNSTSKFIDNMSKLSGNEVADNIATFRFQFYYFIEQSSRQLTKK
jgi:hypothetical protein